jgi:argininosuccinate synthase
MAKASKKTAKISSKKVVLAYSGGLDTSVIIPWLKENYDCELLQVLLSATSLIYAKNF